MHVIHSFGKSKIDEHVHKDVAFLRTNKRGNYLALGDQNFTHMQGLFFFDHKKWELFKTVENIDLGLKMTSIKNNFFNSQRTYKGGAEETFNLFNDSMVYSVKKFKGDLVLELDFRAMFDFDDKGRIYSVIREDDVIIIRYDKYFDDSLSVINKSRFLVIKGADNYKKIGEWVKKNYVYDEKRHSKSELYVYKALSIKVNESLGLVFSFSDNKDKAKLHAQRVYENKEYLINSLKKYAEHSFATRDLALSTSLKALDDLLINVERRDRSVGLFAGLPWFYQFWSRDELISLKAVMLKEKYYLVKSILFKYLEAITDDGLIPNRLPSSDLKSIDAVGWMFLRIKDYIKVLTSKKILSEYLSVSDIIKIKQTLEKAIHGLAHNHSKNKLIINNEQETWMDSKPPHRSGVCIEIQALFLAMINLHNNIASITRSKQIFKTLEKEHKQRVKQEFFNKGVLLDSVGGVYNDAPSQTRPNIFLAYYIYPDLLSKKEWKQAFDNALKLLWLDWGGLSSISHKSSLFRSEYSGIDDLSYHNGDSWYFVNNFAAIAMHRLDKKHYAKYIKRILGAGKEEMFFSGFIGCCSEISSAKNMRSEGCLSQAWSTATLIELFHELHASYF